MGLLDDAIREHLELKRRHGADPGEVARQEQEALGPARRGPEPLAVQQQATAEAADDPAVAEAPAPQELGAEAADPALIEPQVDAPLYQEPDEDHGAVAMGDVEAVPEPAAEAPAPPVTPERSDAVAPDEDAVAVDEEAGAVAWEEPAPPAPEPEPVAEDPGDEELDAGQPTVAWDAADVQEAQRRPAPEPEPEPEPQSEPPVADAPQEDVLEETPDFLQETPEHDRLWFEQRPPRDFDFDD